MAWLHDIYSVICEIIAGSQKALKEASNRKDGQICYNCYKMEPMINVWAHGFDFDFDFETCLFSSVQYIDHKVNSFWSYLIFVC